MPLNGPLMPYTHPEFDVALLNFGLILKLGALVGWGSEAC